MKFVRTPQFKDDFNNLEIIDKEAVQASFLEVSKALQGDTGLYKKYRIKKMEGHPDIWEGHVRGNSLCFTFEKRRDESGETEYLFRRVGTHAIYKKP